MGIEHAATLNRFRQSDTTYIHQTPITRKLGVFTESALLFYGVWSIAIWFLNQGQIVDMHRSIAMIKDLDISFWSLFYL